MGKRTSGMRAIMSGNEPSDTGLVRGLIDVKYGKIYSILRPVSSLSCPAWCLPCSTGLPSACFLKQASLPFLVRFGLHINSPRIENNVLSADRTTIAAFLDMFYLFSNTCKLSLH